jgi:2-aminoadipate transaminase
MFMLARLPSGVSSLALFDEGIRQGVAVMPGPPFYLEGGDDVIRLNFSNTDPERCAEGIGRLSRALSALG